MQRLYGVFILGVLLGCSGTSGAMGDGEDSPASAAAPSAGGMARPEPDGKGGQRMVVVTPEPTPKDPINVDGVSLEGDMLTLEVIHGGGCAQHDYQLAWNGAFMESLPVQARLVLVHDAHGDPCKALVRKALQFDLSPLKEQWREGYREEHGTIVLHLPGSPSPIRYTF